MSLKNIQTEFAKGKISKSAYIDEMYQIHSSLFDYADFINSTNISKIEIENSQVVMTFRDSGIKFICTEGDKRLAPFDALNFGAYEEAELFMQMQLINPKSTVLDIGGNYGWYAIHIAKKFPDAKIYSFEPIPKTFDHLKKNISLNNLKNIQPFNFGLSDVKGEFNLYYDPTLSVNASLQNVSGSNNVQTITCQIDTIDNYCSANDLQVDFIKCDVEGAELLAFKGGVKILEKNSPIIFSEMLRKWTAKFNYHPNDIINLLSGFGYKCFTLDGNKLKSFHLVDENTVETNYFFLHTIKHAKEIKDYTVK